MVKARTSSKRVKKAPRAATKVNPFDKPTLNDFAAQVKKRELEKKTLVKKNCSVTTKLTIEV